MFLGQKLCLLTILLFYDFSLPIQAQTKESIVLNGYVKDASNLETLVGATIFVNELKIGTTTNLYGYYAIKMPKREDSLTVTISYIGYQTQKKRILPNQDLTLSVDLPSNEAVLEAIVVTENANRQLIEENQMGRQKITVNDLKTIPVILGESDVIKILQLTPGIQSGAEGTSGFYVRGGGFDQNLILLDEAVVYNPEHAFGFFSTFNSDIVKNIEVYKGDFPARYGGRLSSVIDIQMREGNQRQFEGQGGIGLISSRLTLEGPIVKDKSSFVISGRRTYFDIFIPPINKRLPPDQQIPDYFFYDLNAKVNYVLGEKDRLYLSGYFGKDRMNIAFNAGAEEIANSSYNLQWGNITGTLRWNHIYSPRLFSNTTFTVSRFRYNDRFNFDDFFEFRSSSKTRTYTFKQDFDFYASSKHNVKFGAHLTHHFISPTDFFAGTSSDDPDLEIDAISEKQEYTGQEIGVYASDDWQIAPRFGVEAGLRFSGFLTSTRKLLSAVEPRVSFNYQLRSDFSVKGSYARMAQYLHQVKFSYLSSLDPFFPSNENIKPQLSDQVSAGWNWLILNDQVSITNEYYYKWLHNQLEYQNAADYLFINEDYHERLAVGRGWSYGTELQIQKTKGRLTGWLAYTLAWSRRQFDDLNNGNSFPFTYDRRHVVNLVAQYQLSKTWKLSANWTYQTGIALDLAVGRLFVYGVSGLDPEVVPIYQELNSFRMPAYHRLDIGLIKELRKRKNWESDITISIYNAYNRRNPFFIFYDQESGAEAGTVRFVAKQISLFPIIPSVSYNFRF